MRTFICLDFPDSVVKEVARLQELIGGKKFVGKFTELENLHLTLKFLGEISLEKIEEVRSCLRALEFKGFEASLGVSGTFSFRGAPKIAWVKVNGKAIYDLQKKIDECLRDIFPIEERFMSHLTIARIKHVPESEEFKKFILGLSPRKIKFNVDRFYLKSSELHEMGPMYSVVEEFALGQVK